MYKYLQPEGEITREGYFCTGRQCSRTADWGLGTSCSPVPWREELQGLEVLWHIPVIFPLQGIHTHHTCARHQRTRGWGHQIQNHTSDPARTPAWVQIGDILSGLDPLVVLRRGSGSNRRHMETFKSCLLLPGHGLGKGHGVWCVADTSNPEAETVVQRVFFVSNPQRYPSSLF